MKLLKCTECGAYTMKDSHHNKPTVSAHPIKFGVEKYIEQRIKMKRDKS